MLLLLCACASGPSNTFAPNGAARIGDTTQISIEGPTAERTDKPTVYRFEWTTEAPATAAIEWVEDDASAGYTHSEPARTSEDGLSHEVLLTGLAAEGTYHWRATWENPDGSHTVTLDDTFTVDPAPSDLPVFTVTGDAEMLTGAVIVTLITPETKYAVVIVDRLGRYLWWQKGEDESSISQARISLDGDYVEWNTWEPSNAMHRMSLDGADYTILPVEGTHHDFAQVPDGWVVLSRDEQDVDGETITGDKLEHVDFDGNVEELWSIWDEHTYDEEADEADSPDGDWTHVNSLEYEADLDAWWLSVRQFDAVMQVSNTTWTTDWTLGGRYSDFTLTDGEEFQQQHSARRVDGGELLLFDNGDETRNTTRVVQYAIDTETMTYEEVWSYDAPDAIFARYTGSADRLADGGTFIVWGSGGKMSQLDADGDEVWSATRGDTDGFGYGRVLDDF